MNIDLLESNPHIHSVDLSSIICKIGHLWKEEFHVILYILPIIMICMFHILKWFPLFACSVFSSHRVRKSEVQAALAKAQAKAFVTMSPIKRQQVMNFDPTGHLYGIPQTTFDEFTLHGFGSDRATTASTAFSAGSSDCDYSS